MKKLYFRNTLAICNRMTSSKIDIPKKTFGYQPKEIMSKTKQSHQYIYKTMKGNQIFTEVVVHIFIHILGP